MLAGSSHGALNYSTFVIAIAPDSLLTEVAATLDVPCVTSVTTRTDVFVSTVYSPGFSSTSTGTSAGSLTTASFTPTLNDGLKSAADATLTVSANTLTTSSPGDTYTYLETAFCVETIVQCGSLQTTLTSVPTSASQIGHPSTTGTIDPTSTESGFLGTTMTTSWPDGAPQTSDSSVDGSSPGPVSSESGSSGGSPPPPPPLPPNPSPSGTITPTPTLTTASTASATGSKDGECTTSAVASCLEEVHVLTEYFTLGNVSTSTVETSTETRCVSISTCEGKGTTTTTTTSSSTSERPTATCTAQLIVPQYEAKIDDASYFVPLCKSGSQTLWRSDGTSLKIDCRGIKLSTGESFQIPADLSNATDSKCHDVTNNGTSVCYSKRFPTWNATQDTVAILASREENEYSNVTAISEALEYIGNHDGLAEVGCESSDAYYDVAAYYFGRVQTPLEEITSSDQNITEFYHEILSSSQNVTSHGSTWIPQADEMLQNLMCHIDTSDGKSSRLVRALSKQSNLHTGINTLVSIANVDESQKSIRNLIKDLFDNYVSYIGRESSIIQGWTQAYRLCLTTWDEGSLSNPQSQKPIQDDIDDWYATYSMITSPGTTMDELRGLEHALGVEGSETAPADGNPDLWKAYTAELNLVQAKLPDSTEFVNMTSRFVWNGEPMDRHDPFEGAGVPDTEPDSSEKSRLFDNTATPDTAHSSESKQDSDRDGSGRNVSHGHRFDQPGWRAPTEYPPPAANAKSVTRLTGNNHLKLISQQKGQSPSNTNSYIYAPPAGKGSWIFVIDDGFDLKHEVIHNWLPYD